MLILLLSFVYLMSPNSEAAATPAISNRVMFLCTGNYYRSRLAEAVFNFRAAEAGLNWKAFSRGLHVTHLERTSASPEVYQKLDELRIPHSFAHGVPAAVTRADLEKSDLIVILNREEHEGFLNRLLKPVDEFRILFWNIDDVEVLDAEIAMNKVVREVDALIEQLKREDLPLAEAR